MARIEDNETLVQRVIFGYMCFWCLIMAVFMFIWWPYIGGFIAIFVGIGSTLLLLALYMSYRVHYRLTIAIIPVYIIILTLGLYPLLAIEWQFGRVSTYIWYLTAPVKISVIYTRRQTLYWSIYLLALIVSSFFTGALFPPLLSGEMVANGDLLATLQRTAGHSNVCTLVIAFLDVMYFLYFRGKLVCVLPFGKKNDPDDARKTDSYPEIDSDTRYDVLYERIVRYMEAKKPYKRTDFNISQLAVALHTNMTYISKAIQHCTGMNFATYINTCRIRYIKDLLVSNPDRFTLRHIYTSSGFSSQSTFNRTFKSIEGMTPSEYCRQINVILPDEDECEEEVEEDEENA